MSIKKTIILCTDNKEENEKFERIFSFNSSFKTTLE